jgi:hypothetical protein
MTRETHIPTVADGTAQSTAGERIAAGLSDALAHAQTGTAQGTHTPGEWALDGHCLSSVIVCTVPRGHPDAKHLCGDYAVIAEFKGPNWAANARLASAAPDGLEAAEKAYLALLGIPLGSTYRLLYCQEPMARLRDFIAKATGRDIESVQNEFEARAALSKAEGRS